MGARTSRICRVVMGATLITAVTAQIASAGPPLRRDLSAYLVFGMRNVSLKNFTLNGACNTGVNCENPQPNNSCGVIVHENATYDEGSQIVGDRARFNRPGASIWQLFTNPPFSGLDNVVINSPPGTPEPFTPPVLGDIDNDGNPSCSLVNNQCSPDYGDLYTACNFANPFPACDETKPVLVLKNQDCLLATDVIPNNGRCDLAPGTYGGVTLNNDGALQLTGGGTFNFCRVAGGQRVNITADLPALVNISAGDFNIKDGSNVGPGPGIDCGQITVNVTGANAISFGRDSNINGFFCGPESELRLGHNNNLTGRFVGDVVNADSNDRGFCCTQGSGCACFDTITPKTASVGQTVALSGACTLTAVTKVTVCGIAVNPPFVSQTADKLEFVVPAGAAGACVVTIESASGVFTGVDTLQVN
jgi:hypothetical protein